MGCLPLYIYIYIKQAQFFFSISFFYELKIQHRRLFIDAYK